MKHQVLEARQRLGQHILLRNEPRQATDEARLNRLSVDSDRSADRGARACGHSASATRQDIEEGGFSGPRGTHNSGDGALAVARREIGVSGSG